MDNPNDLFQDDARKPVPSEWQVKGWHIVAIYIGIAMTLPAYLTGGQIGLGSGGGGDPDRKSVV